MSDYRLWEPAWRSRQSLGPRAWLDLAVVDAHLLNHWMEHSHMASAVYVDSTWAMMGKHWSHREQDETVFFIPQFRRKYMLPGDIDQACPMTPVVFSVLHNAHFFVVVMDTERLLVHVLGRTPTTDQDAWDEWNGPDIFRWICRLHGWPLGRASTEEVRDQVIAQGLGWVGNGYDCGPQAVIVATHVMDHGLHYSRDPNQPNTLSRPPLPCCHPVRMKMYRDLVTMSYVCFTEYQRRFRTPPDAWLEGSVTGRVESYAPAPHDLVHSLTHRAVGGNDLIYQGLQREQLACIECQNVARPPPTEDRRRLPPTPEDTPRDRDIQPVSVLDENVEDQGRPPSPDEYGVGPGGRRRLGVTQRGGEGGWSKVGLHRFPRPDARTRLPTLNELPRPLWLPFDRNYDDYFQGPTEESFPSTDLERHLTDLHPSYTFDTVALAWVMNTQSSPWTRFTDHGWRILPRWMQMFFSGEPLAVRDHILTVGVEETYRPDRFWERKDAADDEVDAIDRYGMPRDRRPTDVKTVGLGEFLRLTSGPDPESEHDVMVRGRTKDGRYLRIDLERDGRIVPVEQVQVSVDVDSLVWVTRKVKMWTTVYIVTSPTVQPNPPIGKHNHIYVELLSPPRDAEDQARVDDRSWTEVKTPLSGIPHTPFARVRDGQGSFTVYIFFPRMVHRNEHTRRREVKIPFPVQALFWELVVLPALVAVSPEYTMPYVDYTVDERLRRGAGPGQRKGGSYKPKGIELDDHLFLRMQEHMANILEDRTVATFDRFRSHFYVLEAKGIKLHTMSPADEGPQLWRKLQQRFPALDLEYMMDRKNGELILDIGFGFQPVTRTPLVGLHRSEALEASAGVAGFRQGYLHTAETFAGYGSLQTEMRADRSVVTHVVFRSAYNLCYEPRRTKDNVPTFVDDSEAYHVTEKYMNECAKAVETYGPEVRKRSYGTRDEYRLGGLAAKEVLDHAPELVRISDTPRGTGV